MTMHELHLGNGQTIPGAIFDDPREFGRFTAERIRDLIAGADRDVAICFATGATPLPVYEHLVEMHAAGDVSFDRVYAFLLDEYLGLPEGHEQSFATFMRRHLFDAVALPAARFHAPNGRGYNPVEESRRYREALEAAGGLDLTLLGIGPNGHIAFNEPGSRADEHVRLVALAPKTREANARFFGSLDQVPKHAITIGIADILASRRLILMATGAGKAEILERALRGPITPDVPASFLQTHPGELTLVADRAAASRLID